MSRAGSIIKIVPAALGLVVALSPGLVSAQSAVPPVRSPQQEETYEPVAEGLFRSGLRAFDAGDFDAACAALWASLHIDPKLGALLNLALCHEKQGRMASAWLEYAHAGAWAAELGQTNRHDFAQEHGEALERRLFRVRLVLPAEPVLWVEIDGEPLPGALRSLPIFLDPGDHTITVSAPGRKAYQHVLHVLPGANAVDVRVPVLEPASTTPHAPAPLPVVPPRDTRRTVVFVLGAASVVALGLGAVFGAEAITKLDDACTEGSCGSGLRDQARTWEVGSLIGFGLGAAALGVGVALSLGSPRRATHGATSFLLRPLGSGAELGMSQAW